MKMNRFWLVGPFTAMLAVVTGLGYVAQEEAPAEAKLVTVPLIGCPADGQTGPLDAPENGSVELPIPADAARDLAYYSTLGYSVLAPRGWNCIGVYGSSGSSIIVTPEVIQPMEMFGNKKLAGELVVLKHTWGFGSGSSTLAEVIRMAFPKYQEHAESIEEMYGPPAHSGPYPDDVLLAISDSVVAFETPAEKEGMGTQLNNWIEPNQNPIRGVAMLVGPNPDLLLIQTRFEVNPQLADVILQEAQRDPVVAQ